MLKVNHNIIIMLNKQNIKGMLDSLYEDSYEYTTKIFNIKGMLNSLDEDSDEDTIEIFNILNKDMKRILDISNKYMEGILDISNKDIEGILDLSKYGKLKKLYCSNNKITEIINIPNSLEYLNCSNNKITKLENNFNLMKINYKFNPLTHLTLRGKLNKPVDNLPCSLIELILGNIFNQPIDNLPCYLIKLVLGDRFNQPIDNLPCSLEILILGNGFNQSIDNLPSSLKQLILGDKFNKCIDNLPNSIIELTLDDNFNQPICKLPHNLTNLKIKIINFEFEYLIKLKKINAQLKINNIEIITKEYYDRLINEFHFEILDEYNDYYEYYDSYEYYDYNDYNDYYYDYIPCKYCYDIDYCSYNNNGCNKCEILININSNFKNKINKKTKNYYHQFAEQIENENIIELHNNILDEIYL